MTKKYTMDLLLKVCRNYLTLCLLETLANSALHNASFHQRIHCFLRLKRSSGKDIQFYFRFYNLWPSISTMKPSKVYCIIPGGRSHQYTKGLKFKFLNSLLKIQYIYMVGLFGIAQSTWESPLNTIRIKTSFFFTYNKISLYHRHMTDVVNDSSVP